MTFRTLPSWAINLLGFGLLIVLVLVAFFWQMNRTNAGLQHNALGRSSMVAAIIEENLSNAALAQETIDTIVTSFLHDKARFIDYLDGIEPLRSEELAALARETGLLGISLFRLSGETVAGPEGWFAGKGTCNSEDGLLHYLMQEGTGYIDRPGNVANSDIDCIRLGLDASSIIALRNKTGLPVLLGSLSALPGIHSVRLEVDAAGAQDNPSSVKLIRNGTNVTAEARMLTAMGMLVVNLDAQNFIKRRDRLKSQFILFGSLLMILGLFFSWLLYRFQKNDLKRTRNFERTMAREHEAASLGRATATIAHEIRNPLNAINMGLQRLTLESDNLNPEQEELITAMREAVTRTSTIVTELQRFTRPLTPKYAEFQLEELVQQSLALYKPSYSEQDIAVQTDYLYTYPIYADRELMAELVENLLKNSIEAQPRGGFISIALKKEEDFLFLSILNGGCTLSTEETARLGEPYFTTKIRGTGLGLALCRRIVEAHNGELRIETNSKDQTLTISIRLPNPDKPELKVKKFLFPRSALHMDAERGDEGNGFSSTNKP